MSGIDGVGTGRSTAAPAGSAGDDDLVAGVPVLRVAGVAGLVATASFALAAALTGVAVEGRIAERAELLATISEHRVTFLLANAAGLGCQLATVFFLIGIARWSRLGRAEATAVWASWAAGAGLLAVSSAVHATYALVPARIAEAEAVLDPAALDPALVDLASSLHHLADWCYFGGIIGLALALVVLAAAGWRGTAAARGGLGILPPLAAATAACHLGQLGWVAGVEPMQLLGIPGLLGQVVVGVLVSRALLRDAARR